MEISTLSPLETVQLYSSFIYTTTDALNCKKTAERGGKDRARDLHNCDFKFKRKIFDLDEITWYSCLCRFQHPNFHQLMVLSKFYEKGVLPDDGTVLDQPNSLIEQLELIDYLKNKHKEHQQQEIERKNNGRSQHRPQAKSGKRPNRSSPGSRPNKSN